MKAVLKGEFIAVDAYNKKKETSPINNPTLLSQGTRKRRTNKPKLAEEGNNKD